MIKVALDNDGRTSSWGVVRQVDHARLAFDLAERSRLLAELPVSTRREVLCAIDHHDDGWQERDLAIEIDQDRGRPRTFDEMTAAEAIDIWTKSIDRAGGFGPWSAWTVAGHITYLAILRQGTDKVLCTDWADKIEQRRGRLLAEWLGDDSGHRHDHAAIAVTCLRLFDSLSLYVIGVGDQPERTLTLPDGNVATVVRHDVGHYSADPWIFDFDRLDLTIAGVRIDGIETAGAWTQTLEIRPAHSV
jgi:hypothetical protein